MLGWLQAQPGDTWQERWEASGAEDQPRLAGSGRGLAGRAAWRAGAGQRRCRTWPGLLVLICADVIRPGLGWLLRFAPARRGLAAEMARTRDSAAFAELDRDVPAAAAVGLADRADRR